jgi:hypothetical protein
MFESVLIPLRSARVLIAEPNWLENRLYLVNVTMPVRQLRVAGV